MRTAQENDRLLEALTALGRAERDVTPAPSLRAAVMAAWDAEQHRRRRVRSHPLLAVAAGIAFILVLTAARFAPIELPRLPPANPAARPAVLRAAQAGPDDMMNLKRAAARQVRIPRPTSTPRPATTVVMVGGPLRDDEPVRLVRMQIDRSALMTIGLDQPGAATGGRIEVDVLVGEDGVARGLRLGM